ncbi:uncharacterized protein LOC26535973 [Drosophila yakuba]|uniref:Uncharacterized protein n=1 Tax=Drosophila yakuba TaxID=7245 RepID=A0A0R1E741_DROYA|nr:uncharacterized protein LOC26535973 [Drosophila yakuba]KRK03175.1 uncharacterized protein Dyak_GE28792 [Drosophila yakuba]
MVKLDLEKMLETLLSTVRRRKSEERREKGVEIVPKKAEDVQELESSNGLFTEGVINWVYRKIMDLAVTVLEKLMDFVEAAILRVVNAVEYFYQDFKVQCVALGAFVEYLTNRLGFQIEM